MELQAELGIWALHGECSKYTEDCPASMINLGSFPLPVTVLKGALLRGVLITPITLCGNSYCKGE